MDDNDGSHPTIYINEPDNYLKCDPPYKISIK